MLYYTTRMGSKFTIFSREDHARLFESLRSVKGKFLLSYQDCPEIRDLYKDFHIHSMQAVCNINTKSRSKSPTTELLIANYPLPN